jgi:hypothetical protein
VVSVRSLRGSGQRGRAQDLDARTHQTRLAKFTGCIETISQRHTSMITIDLDFLIGGKCAVGLLRLKLIYWNMPIAAAFVSGQ